MEGKTALITTKYSQGQNIKDIPNHMLQIIIGNIEIYGNMWKSVVYIHNMKNFVMVNIIQFLSV